MSAQQNYTAGAIALRSFLVLAGSAFIILGYLYLSQSRAGSSNSASSSPGVAIMTSPFLWPGINNPHTYSADEAPVRDDDDVIGIDVGGKARAYLVSAFAGFQHHVVNDVLAGQPVSVTHCDLHNCTRVFTGSEQGKPLQLSCGGQSQEGGLVLMAPGDLFDQETGHSLIPDAPGLPYQRFPFVVTTWAEWKRAHPNSDVYVGDDSDVMNHSRGKLP
jgi:hypothetical protein